MSVSIHEGCGCCAPCCGITGGQLFGTLDICGAVDPDPIPLDVVLADADITIWQGLFECDNCVFALTVRCERLPSKSDLRRWVYDIERDEGPGACSRCEVAATEPQSIDCSPLEIVFAAVTFPGPSGCDKCNCSPATGPMTLVVTQ